MGSAQAALNTTNQGSIHNADYSEI